MAISVMTWICQCYFIFFLSWPARSLSVFKQSWLYKTSLPHKTNFFSLEEFVQDYCYFIKCLGDFNGEKNFFFKVKITMTTTTVKECILNVLTLTSLGVQVLTPE